MKHEKLVMSVVLVLIGLLVFGSSVLASISTGEICSPNCHVKTELSPMRWRFVFLRC